MVCGTTADASLEDCPRCGTPLTISEGPPRVDFSDIMSLSWTLYGRNLGACLAVGLLDALLTIVAVVIALVPATVAFMVVMDAVGPPQALLSMFLVLGLGVSVAIAALAVGHIRFFLSVARGEPAELNHLWQSRGFVSRMALGNLLFWAMVLFGLLSCVLPGILAWVLFWPFGRILVDEDTTAIGSLQRAWSITTQNLGTSFLIGIATFFILNLANIIPFGFILAVPYVGLIHSVAYMHFTGEPTCLEVDRAPLD